MPDNGVGELHYVSVEEHFTRLIQDEHRYWESFLAEREKVVTGLIAATKDTAERAVAKAEAAAERALLESQITGLREQFNHQIATSEKALHAALAAQEKAVSKAEIAANDRFHSVNEFRAQLADQQRTYVVKSEVDYRFIAIEEKLGLAVTTLSETKGKGAGLNAAWIFSVSAISLIATIIGAVAILTSNA